MNEYGPEPAAQLEAKACPQIRNLLGKILQIERIEAAFFERAHLRLHPRVVVATVKRFSNRFARSAPGQCCGRLHCIHCGALTGLAQTALPAAQAIEDDADRGAHRKMIVVARTEDRIEDDVRALEDARRHSESGAEQNHD